jgi:hypothetical protein
MLQPEKDYSPETPLWPGLLAVMGGGEAARA